jgi:ATP-dependent DNA helicase RecG
MRRTGDTEGVKGRASRPRLDDSPAVLPGVGPKTAAALEQLGVMTVRDLVLHAPLRYEDRSYEVSVEAPGVAGDRVLVRGRLEGVGRVRVRRRRLDIVRATLRSETGAVLPVVWFNQGWMEERARTTGEVRLWGALRDRRGGGLELLNPELAAADTDEEVVPVYRRLGPLAGRRLRRVVEAALAAVHEMSDPLGSDDRERWAVTELCEALTVLHRPSTEHLGDGVDRARRRLAFDELLQLTGRAELRRLATAHLHATPLEGDGERRRGVLGALRFELTGAQRRALEEIARDMSRPRPMTRLLQGDVGCGKTVVAALSMLMAVDGGLQAALMAPTETLVRQHARTLDRLFEPIGLEVDMLVGSLHRNTMRDVRQRVASGHSAVVVGTHALFQQQVTFDRLALVVVDEQHRFGVLQRQALVAKGSCPHVLVMTATPIPRSLALTVYGDLDLSVIDERPPGRQPVRTVLRTSRTRSRLSQFLRREITEGGRVFWVFPLIEGSDDVSAPALEEHEARVRSELPDARVGVVHGRLDASERETATEAFRRGRLDVLLATTVIEVGIDVPEASVMVIEGAERFGLSQLHQLRGRVGRGERRSWCVILTDDELSPESRRRLELFCREDDGFRLAEADLELRGPGDMGGIRQWGRDGLRFAHLGRDAHLIRRARAAARWLADQGRLSETVARIEAFYGGAAGSGAG